MIVAWATDLPNTIVTTEISLIDCEENMQKNVLGRSPNDNQNVIAAVHYKQTIDRDTQMN